MMGLLHVQTGGGGLAKLLKKFETVGGVSGGHWFLSMLIYSSSFEDLVNRGSWLPGQAGKIFNLGYTLKLFKDWSSLQAPTAQDIRECIQATSDLVGVLKRSLSATQEEGEESVAEGPVPSLPEYPLAEVLAL